jgi:16S rRNA (uracil1498-N3)-methyltransferase
MNESRTSSEVARLLRVPVAGLRTGQVRLDREASHYLVHVRRASVGAEFLAFDVEAATEAPATLVVADSRCATCAIEAVRASCRLPQFRLILLQAFAKGAKVDQVVRDATALDISELWILSTSRSSMSSPKEIRGRLDRWRKIAVNAARQCERGNIPSISGVVGLDETLRSFEEFSGHKWVLSPRAPSALGDKLGALHAADAALLVGPEGGLEDHEVQLARACGFTEVRIGSRVLRTETAALAALGAIAAFRDCRQTSNAVVHHE